jgi:hypothetical protein
MAIAKQTAKRSTGGKAPREELSRRAARTSRARRGDLLFKSHPLHLPRTPPPILHPQLHPVPRLRAPVETPRTHEQHGHEIINILARHIPFSPRLVHENNHPCHRLRISRQINLLKSTFFKNNSFVFYFIFSPVGQRRPRPRRTIRPIFLRSRKRHRPRLGLRHCAPQSISHT